MRSGPARSRRRESPAPLSDHRPARARAASEIENRPTFPSTGFDELAMTVYGVDLMIDRRKQSETYGKVNCRPGLGLTIVNRRSDPSSEQKKTGRCKPGRQ